jgi:hypothetical protein
VVVPAGVPLHQLSPDSSSWLWRRRGADFWLSLLLKLVVGGGEMVVVGMGIGSGLVLSEKEERGAGLGFIGGRPHGVWRGGARSPLDFGDDVKGVRMRGAG